MRTKTLGGFLVLLSLLGVVTQAAPLGTAFTYQGQLSDGGLPANGNYDFTFTLFDQGSSVSPIAGPLTNAMVEVNHGLFTTTLDFGHGVLTGNDRWLEIAVRSNGVPTSFSPLTPRQLLTASPYALFAPSAGVAASAATANTVAAGGVAGASLQANAVTTDKIADDTVAAADVNADTFNTTFWRASGNIGTTPGTHFIGTTDHQPVEIKVNLRRAFRLEPDAAQDAPNLIAGSSANTVSPGVVGAVIGGGGRDVDPNRVLGAWGTIGGGQGNIVSNHYDVVSGGLGNRAGGGWSTVGGGSGNAADNVVLGRATVAGGMENRASGQVATVGGGRDNAATNSYATVPGGRNNLAGGEDSLAAGRRALALHDGAFVWADATDADFASTQSNQFLIRASGGVGIGTGSPAEKLDVAQGNVVIRGPQDFVPGTDARLNLGDPNNYVRAVWGEGLRLGVWQGADALVVNNGGNVGIGLTNPLSKLHVAGTVTANSFSGSGAGLTGLSGVSLVAGSVSEAALAPNILWRLSGNSGTTAGTHFLGTTDHQPLELKVNGLRVLRVEDNGDGSDYDDSIPDGAPNLIGGAPNNQVAGGVVGATISGGGALNQDAEARPNTISADYAAIGGGLQNAIQSDATGATIGGGYRNAIQGGSWESSIAGGARNEVQANAIHVSIGGGDANVVQAGVHGATVAGGLDNTIGSAASTSTIGGGWKNKIQSNSFHATIGGGAFNAIHPNSQLATIGGGYWNIIQTNGYGVTIGGGEQNAGGASNATVAGGSLNAALRNYATIGGGHTNIADGYAATIGGGQNNVASDSFGTISGGNANSAGVYGMVPGGAENNANGQFSLAAGRRAKALHDGSFVWADSTYADFPSTAPNQFNLRASGGVRVETGSGPGISLSAADTPLITRGWDSFATTAPVAKQGHGRWGLFMEPYYLVLGIPNLGGRGLQVAKYETDGTRTPLMTVDQGGAVTATVFNPPSDRNAKQNFTPVDSRAILQKVAALPISRWNFKTDAHASHVGPMAQDFHAAFGLGTDDKHIATVDADGVALAAIQGLNQRLNEQESEIQELKRVIAELKTTGAKPPSVR